MSTSEIKANQGIRARELRVIGPKGENLGILSLGEALKAAGDYGLDLIEISPNAKPPIAKIADLGKYQYEIKKKQKVQKAKQHQVEVKSLQVKVGTCDHDLELKAKKASEWLSQGNKVKIDLFLPGRLKFMEERFLKERIDRILKLLTLEYKISEQTKKSPKGMTLVIEKA